MKLFSVMLFYIIYGYELCDKYLLSTLWLQIQTAITNSANSRSS